MADINITEQSGNISLGIKGAEGSLLEVMKNFSIGDASKLPSIVPNGGHNLEENIILGSSYVTISMNVGDVNIAATYYTEKPNELLYAVLTHDTSVMSTHNGYTLIDITYPENSLYYDLENKIFIYYPDEETPLPETAIPVTSEQFLFYIPANLADKYSLEEGLSHLPVAGIAVNLQLSPYGSEGPSFMTREVLPIDCISTQEFLANSEEYCGIPTDEAFDYIVGLVLTLSGLMREDTGDNEENY